MATLINSTALLLYVTLSEEAGRHRQHGMITLPSLPCGVALEKAAWSHGLTTHILVCTRHVHKVSFPGNLTYWMSLV
jgi:hypothetical protein